MELRDINRSGPVLRYSVDEKAYDLIKYRQ